ncbi:MAG TPA: phosphoglucosamine mutase [Bacteroidales bacterium]|jgi:phosphomannomutase|nr:phosphoglucosamine mutase [Bacteroidales bacterium]HXK81206.1 phosphoglucosamine mutase [Bacteroidales bacterium]
MTLIKSISGIRGTIGGKQGEGLSPIDIVKFTAAYADLIQNLNKKKSISIVTGRDARISGKMVHSIVNQTLCSMGCNVIDIGMASTPTTEMAVKFENAYGGIIITASHNPRQWNALKLLNNKGEFLNAEEGKYILKLAEAAEFDFSDIDNIGTVSFIGNYELKHIRSIIDLELVDISAIQKANFTVAIDCVNSVGGICIPPLLKALGVKEIIELYTEPTGEFPHNPEPLPEHLTEISELIVNKKADVGFVVDPDVDRLAIVCEDGKMFGEEYTLVAVADYILQHKKGNTVSNMSSTRALRDITESYGGKHFASAVGEVNVVAEMKKQNAVIGGEGNGGVIYPPLHYGRDALVGIALFLTNLAKRGTSVSKLRAGYPNYVISKNKIQLTPDIDVDNVLSLIHKKYQDKEINTADGIKIIFNNSEWVHLRKSNTEPIIRIYAESTNNKNADLLAQNIIKEINILID